MVPLERVRLPATAITSYPLVLTSKRKEPPFRVRLLLKESVPMLVPGTRVVPATVVTLPVTTPLPERVWLTVPPFNAKPLRVETSKVAPAPTAIDTLLDTLAADPSARVPAV